MKIIDEKKAWIPTQDHIKETNLALFMEKHKFSQFNDFHQWSVQHYPQFWEEIINTLEITFQKKPEQLCDISKGIEFPNWLPNAKLNIAESCFKASPTHTAIIYQTAKNEIKKITYSELNALSNRIANSLVNEGFNQGDAIAIDMPMTAYAVAIYLGIIKMGGIVVSIADSFSQDEIATRLTLANTKAIFTQDFILRDAKKLPLYEKVKAANAPKAIVIPCEDNMGCELRDSDVSWQTFLVSNDQFKPVSCNPNSYINILFSSGTTGQPKAIPWNQATPIKAASDAYFHHNVKNNDIFAWPTNLGWMMGPWLIFATLINRATIALFDGAPKDHVFGKFIQDAKVTILGVIPTMVAGWHQSKCMENLDWHTIKLFASTGESSNPDDMAYLMSLAGHKPIIEYCGGTEIGGAYITSTLIENNYPSVFTTPALGLDFVLLDEEGNLTENGEVALVPPSIGLSTELLNANHHEIYFANMPTTPDGKILRRHGDQVQRINANQYYVLGRSDDTMKLGGIKVSSAEIERTVAGIDGISETAAIGVATQGYGPKQLIIFAVTQLKLNKADIMKQMQQQINQHLNPLFKVHDVIFIDVLPKTASNKIMRRKLRDSLNV